MSVDGIIYSGEEMCRSCGNCSAEHSKNIDDAVDAVEESGVI